MASNNRKGNYKNLLSTGWFPHNGWVEIWDTGRTDKDYSLRLRKLAQRQLTPNPKSQVEMFTATLAEGYMTLSDTIKQRRYNEDGEREEARPREGSNKRKIANANRGVILDAIANLKPNEVIRLRFTTPEEDLALMGITDKHINYMLNPYTTLKERGYSDEEIKKMLVHENTVADIKKQAGNSIVVDVLYNVFRKMFIEKGPE